MRKWILTIVLAALLVFPSASSAQQSITIQSMDVSLWPEFDRDKMLVIYHMLVNADSFPVEMKFRIPVSVEQEDIVVAIGSSSETVSDQGIEYSVKDLGDWQIVSVTVTGPAIQFEYYDPTLTISDSTREYSYTWLGDYDVENLVVIYQEPFGAEQFTSSLALQDDGIHPDGMQYYFTDVGSIEAGKSFEVQVRYEKSTEALSVSRLEVQPVSPVDENTPGRFSWNNTMPYIIGGLGVVMILGGLAYFMQAGRTSAKKPRARHHSTNEDGAEESESYCPQCGTRAKRGDRFCRTCGARLRTQKE